MEDLTTYELGKQAALEDLFDVADELGDVNGVWNVINETLSQELEKNASQEDVAIRLSTEAICYSFLKEASQYYGEYDVSDHEQALSDILVKVAEDFLEKSANIRELFSTTRPTEALARGIESATMSRKARKTVYRDPMSLTSRGAMRKAIKRTQSGQSPLAAFKPTGMAGAKSALGNIGSRLGELAKRR